MRHPIARIRGSRPAGAKTHVGQCVAYVLNLHGYDKIAAAEAIHDTMRRARQESDCEIVKVITGTATVTGRSVSRRLRHDTCPTQECGAPYYQPSTLVFLTRE